LRKQPLFLVITRVRPAERQAPESLQQNERRTRRVRWLGGGAEDST